MDDLSTIIEHLAAGMITVPAGTITLRDDRIQRKWTVDIPSFLIARYPVTQREYAALTGESPSAVSGALLPVENVSWKDAVEFCNRFSKATELESCYSIRKNDETIIFNAEANGYRLPTEAEWEYACRAGTTGIRYGELDEIAWYKKNSDGRTHEVGTKRPNALELYDMLGNVWEWCSDIYDEDVYGSYRILRGGGWFDEERSCMATNRRRSHPFSFKIDDLGFRVARNS